MRLSRIISFLVFLASASLSAESLAPHEVVFQLIRSAKENNLQGVLFTADLVKVATSPKHSLSLSEFIALLKNIDLSQVIIEPVNQKNWASKVTVKVSGRIRYYFDLELQRATIKNQEDHYVVTCVRW